MRPWQVQGHNTRSQGVEMTVIFSRARRDQVDVRRTNWRPHPPRRQRSTGQADGRFGEATTSTPPSGCLCRWRCHGCCGNGVHSGCSIAPGISLPLWKQRDVAAYRFSQCCQRCWHAITLGMDTAFSVASGIFSSCAAHQRAPWLPSRGRPENYQHNHPEWDEHWGMPALFF